MTKFTKLGDWNSLQEYNGKLIELAGNTLEVLQDATAKNYMMKTVLAMGSINIPFLNEILPKVRRLVYVGGDESVKEAISKFCETKDVQEVVKRLSLTSEIIVHRNTVNQYEIYSSSIFSEIEISAKYLCMSGTKIKNLVKYVSQVEMDRENAPFDAELTSLELLHRDFVLYHKECVSQEKPYDLDVLLEIYESYKPI